MGDWEKFKKILERTDSGRRWSLNKYPELDDAAHFSLCANEVGAARITTQ